MQRLNAVVYGVGAMNSIATRFMLEKGVTIVGAIARSPQKVGRDLGDVAGLGYEVGVTVEDDADAVLSRSADIAVVAVNSFLSDHYEHLERCCRHGVNAITLSEEALYPWRTSPALTAQLDALAKEHGVTITGGGHEDSYGVNLVTTLMGTAHRVEGVHGRLDWNVDDYGPEVARVQRLGATVEEFEAWAAGTDRPPTFGRIALDAIAGSLGLTPTSSEVYSRPILADEDRYSKALGDTIPAGRLIGYYDCDTVRTAEGITLICEMHGWSFAEGEHDRNEWRTKGEPAVHLLNDELKGPLTTCAQLVNRMPDVINAPAGFVTVDQLPKLAYRAFPLPTYLR